MNKQWVVSSCVVAILATTFAGCAQKSTKTFGSTAVKELNYSQFEKEFTEGKTTSDEAKARLGKPDAESKMDGVKWYTWYHGSSSVDSNGLTQIPIVGLFAGKIDVKTKMKSLSLGFDDKEVLVKKQWDGEKEQDGGIKGMLAK